MKQESPKREGLSLKKTAALKTDYWKASVHPASVETDFPRVVKDFLSECCLLYHVPMIYLTPDSNMIGPEELRFFTLDQRWLRSFLDGLCSVGRTASVSYAHDAVLLEQVYQLVFHQTPSVRMSRQGRETEAETVREAALALKPDTNGAVESFSGFLLCSELVKGWRGLEFKAFDTVEETEGQQPLTTLRLDTLRDDLLFGIFRGEVRRLEVAQPPEGLHFGFGRTSGPAGRRPVKALRSVKDGALDGREAEIRLRENGAYRVLDVCGTAESLSASGAAEFALQMIQNAYTGVFAQRKQP